jgi:hypothetical protein
MIYRWRTWFVTSGAASRGAERRGMGLRKLLTEPLTWNLLRLRRLFKLLATSSSAGDSGSRAGASARRSSCLEAHTLPHSSRDPSQRWIKGSTRSG